MRDESVYEKVPWIELWGGTVYYSSLNPLHQGQCQALKGSWRKAGVGRGGQQSGEEGTPLGCSGLGWGGERRGPQGGP